MSSRRPRSRSRSPDRYSVIDIDDDDDDNDDNDDDEIANEENTLLVVSKVWPILPCASLVFCLF